MFPQFNWHIMHLGLLVRWLLYYVGTYREVLCKNWLIALHARVFDKHVFSTSTSDTQGGFLVSTPFLWKGDSNKTLTTHNLVHLLQIILAQEKNIQQLTELIQSLQVQLLHCRGGNSTAHGASLNQSSVSYTEAEGHAIVNDWSIFFQISEFFNSQTFSPNPWIFFNFFENLFQIYVIGFFSSKITGQLVNRLNIIFLKRTSAWAERVVGPAIMMARECQLATTAPYAPRRSSPCLWWEFRSPPCVQGQELC